MPDHQEDIQKLGEMIKDIRIAMLTTRDEDGTLRSRPMGTQSAEFDGTLWFFTHASSPKVDEVEESHQVNVAYSDPNRQRYVSVSGWASIVRDRAKMEQLWEKPLEAFFPKGLNDPDIALIRVAVEKAEYWDGPPSKVVMLVGFAKAKLTGHPFHPGENEKISLK